MPTAQKSGSNGEHNCISNESEVDENMPLKGKTIRRKKGLERKLRRKTKVQKESKRRTLTNGAFYDFIFFVGEGIIVALTYLKLNFFESDLKFLSFFQFCL